MKRFSLLSFLALTVCAGALRTADPAQVIDLWPAGKMPGPAPAVEGEERDLTKTEDGLIAGGKIIKLGHVARPQAHVSLPPAEKANGAAVVVCPGGGFHILAWDLEGTEVAEWLNSLGVAAIVLKYRVPTAHHGEDLAGETVKMPKKALGPVMDAQRALSLVRANAEAWRIDPKRVGILGFSAGGETAALAAASLGKRSYGKVDATDEVSCAADFAMLIYPGGLAGEDGSLKEPIEIGKETPPMFFVHAADDRVTCLSSIALFTELKKNGVPGSLHIYATGGHGYGLRPTEAPVTRWPDRAREWLREMALLGDSDARILLEERFVRAWEVGKPLPSLGRDHPHMTLEDAYDIQQRWVKRTLDEAGIGGIKGGVVTPAGQKLFGIEEPIGAILRASGRFEAKEEPVVSLQLFPGLKLETEIAFVVGETIDRPLPKLEDFKKHIRAIVPAVELVAGAWDAPEGKPTAADLAAINVSAAGYIVGDPIDPADFDPRSVKLSFFKDGEELHSATGADCWRGPWETAYWLAGFAHRQGVVLKPGDVILCGALGTIQPGEKGSYEYDAGDLGKIRFAVE